jgi:hypothetical protein
MTAQVCLILEGNKRQQKDPESLTGPEGKAVVTDD